MVADSSGKYVKAEPKKTPPSGVYLVHAICRHDGRSWRESYEIQTSDDWLRMKEK